MYPMSRNFDELPARRELISKCHAARHREPTFDWKEQRIWHGRLLWPSLPRAKSCLPRKSSKDRGEVDLHSKTCRAHEWIPCPWRAKHVRVPGVSGEQVNLTASKTKSPHGHRFTPGLNGNTEALSVKTSCVGVTLQHGTWQSRFLSRAGFTAFIYDENEGCNLSDFTVVAYTPECSTTSLLEADESRYITAKRDWLVRGLLETGQLGFW